jgi:hypothetical protein
MVLQSLKFFGLDLQLWKDSRIEVLSSFIDVNLCLRIGVCLLNFKDLERFRLSTV